MIAYVRMQLFFILHRLINFSVIAFPTDYHNVTHYVYPINKLHCPNNPRIDCNDELIEEVKHETRNILSNSKFMLATKLPFLEAFTIDKCLVVVDNFRHVDIIGEIPILLRHLKISWIWRRRDTKKFSFPNFIWTPAEVSERRENFSSVSSKIAFLDGPFWSWVYADLPAEADVFADHYSRLRISNYWKQTKPWNCHVSVYMFLPIQEMQTLAMNLPVTFYYTKESELLQANILPSVVPPLRYLIFHKELQSLDEKDILKLFLNFLTLALISPHSGSTVNHDIFFIVEASKSTASNFYHLDEIKILSICLQLKTKGEFALTVTTRILEYPNGISDLKSTTSAMCVPDPSNNMQFWSFNLNRDDISNFDSTMEHLLTCQNPIENLGSRWIYHSLESPAENNARANAHVWLSIMGNYTYQNSQWKLDYCHNTKKIRLNRINYFSIELSIRPKFNLHDDQIYQFPVTIPGTPNLLRFLSCGKRGFETITIAKLFSIFDNTTWLFIFLSVSVLTLLFNEMTSESKSGKVKYFLDLTKALVEQGDPISTQVLNMKTTSFIVGSYLLAAIVLSNAFKSTNVYNMVIARKILPYEKLEELVRDGFTIYARSAYTTFKFRKLFWNQTLFKKYWSTDPHMTCWQTTNNNSGASICDVARIDSEILTLFLIHSDNYHEFQKPKDGKTSALKYALSVTRIHPFHSDFSDQVMTFGRSVRSQIADIDFTAHRLDDLKVKMGKFLRNTEMSYLFKFLSQCEKAAVILPLYFCNDWLHRLRNMGHRHAFIGHESYSNTKVSFSIKGLVPQYIIQRIKSIYVSGIRKHWEEITLGSSKYLQSGNFVEKLVRPSMKGNIVGMFIMLGLGHAMSVACFFGEILFISAIYTFF